MENFKHESRVESTNEKQEEILKLLIEKGFLHSQSAANMILALEGKKPVSEFDILIKHSVEDNNKLFEFQNTLKKMGLYFTQRKTELFEDEEADRYLFDVSNDQNLLKEYNDYHASITDEFLPDVSNLENAPYYEKTAYYYGYPISAVKGFVEENRMEYKDLSEEVLHSEIGRFALETGIFILSKDHWKEELVFIQNWADVIKQKYPKIFKFILLGSYANEMQETVAGIQDWDENKKKRLLHKLIDINLDEINVERIKEEIEQMR